MRNIFEPHFNSELTMRFALILVFVLGCNNSPKVTWTDEEKSNMTHYYRAKDYHTQGALIVNRPGSNTFTDAEGKAIKRARELALQEAQLVRDDVLAKAHPDLPHHWREEFQKGLELESQGGSIRGQVLIDKFIDWANATKGEIRIPKGVKER